MSENKQALQVAALKNGTVIDHIPSEKLFTVVQLLGVEQMTSNITIGFNLDSKKLGKKGIIKIADKFFCDEEIIADADILYMTRVQRERFTDLMEYERVKNVYILRNKMLENTRPNLRILHPLPRVNEIAYDVDDNPKAYYFQQAQNGLYAREAILCDVLGITLDDVKNDILL